MGNCTGGFYCGIRLKWNYNRDLNKRYLDISMPGYTTKKFQKYQHEISPHPQHSPYPYSLKKYGTSAQELLQPYDSDLASLKVITRIQKIVSSILYYAQSIDPTIIMTLSTLASEQSKATEKIITNLHHLLVSIETHTDATL